MPRKLLLWTLVIWTLVISSGAALAATATTAVQFCTDQLTGQVLNRSITLTASTNSLFATNHIIYAGVPIVIYPVAGCCTTNLLPGPYDCAIAGINQIFTILVPATNVTITAADWLIAPTNAAWPNAGTAWSMMASDLRYEGNATNAGTAGQALLTDGLGNNYFGTVAGGGAIATTNGSNLILTTNGPVVTGSVSTNWADLAGAAVAAAQAATNSLASTNRVYAFRRAPVFNRPNIGSTSIAGGTVTKSGGQLLTTYKSQYLAVTNASNLQFRFDNACIETPGDNAITIKAAFNDASFSYPILFGGGRTVTIQPGQTVLSDVLPVSVGSQLFYYVQTMVQAPSGGTWMLGLTQTSTSGLEGSTNADQVDLLTTSWIGGTNASYSPSLVYGDVSVSMPTIAYLGDSIGQGYGLPIGFYDESFLNAAFGIFQSYGSLVSHINLCKGGATRFQWVHVPSTVANRLLTMQTANFVIDQLGVNDAVNGVTLANMESDATNFWNGLVARGIKVFATTITPYPISAYETNRVNYNNWLRSNTPPMLSGVFEVADAVETARNSGVWKAGFTVDGVHPFGTNSVNAMAATINPALFVSPNSRTASEPIAGLSQGSSFVGTHAGDGSGLTNVPAAGLASGGTFPAISGSALTSLNANNLASGTVPQARLPSSINSANLGAAALNATNLSGTLQTAQFPLVLPALDGHLLTGISGGASPTFSAQFNSSGGFTNIAAGVALTNPIVTGGFSADGTGNINTTSGTTHFGSTVAADDIITAGAGILVTTAEKITRNSLAANATTALGLTNGTAAVNGTQQDSPALEQDGQGFATGGGTSQQVSFKQFLRPVQGTANPSSVWHLQSAINGGSFGDVLTVTSAGTVAATAFAGDASAMTAVNGTQITSGTIPPARYVRSGTIPIMGPVATAAAASTAYFFGYTTAGFSSQTVEGMFDQEIFETCTIVGYTICIKASGTDTTIASGTYALDYDSGTIVGSTAMTAWTAAASPIRVNVTGLSQAAAAGHHIGFKFTAPAWTVAPTASAGGVIYYTVP